MTAVRGVAIGAPVLGGDERTKHRVGFAGAGRLVEDDDVQIGGRRVGTISDRFGGKGDRADQVAKYLDPTRSTTRRPVDEIDRDSRTLQAIRDLRTAIRRSIPVLDFVRRARGGVEHERADEVDRA